MAVLLIGEIDLLDVWISELKGRMPDLDLQVWTEAENIEDINTVLVWKHPPGALKKFPNLKLIISLGAGVDHLLRDPDLPSQVPVIRLIAPGLTSQMVEYVVLAVLRFQRRTLHYLELQKVRRWEYLPTSDAASFTVGILGMGILGSAVAHNLRTLGFTVRGWSRTPKEIEGIESFYGDEQFQLFLSNCRVLVCLLPLTPKTEGILNLKTFLALPKGSYLINVARGQHLVEADLLTALDSGQIAGACLDVFETEPLPEDHPFWSNSRIIVTPHISAVTLPSDVADQIINAIHCNRTGQPLKNVVDLKRGY